MKRGTTEEERSREMTMVMAAMGAQYPVHSVRKREKCGPWSLPEGGGSSDVDPGEGLPIDVRDILRRTLGDEGMGRERQGMHIRVRLVDDHYRAIGQAERVALIHRDDVMIARASLSRKNSLVVNAESLSHGFEETVVPVPRQVLVDVARPRVDDVNDRGSPLHPQHIAHVRPELCDHNLGLLESFPSLCQACTLHRVPSAVPLRFENLFVFDRVAQYPLAVQPHASQVELPRATEIPALRKTRGSLRCFGRFEVSSTR
mmetsp:Transcript_4780/g.8639  ORF Transcript_4780/g.8639 Transcript_4780/m.8639 type:complete len:259 (+) Transcript_4780:417-1193(+)